jgi:hypothetical protein
MIASWVKADGSAAACFNTASAAPARTLVDCEKYLLAPWLLLAVLTTSGRVDAFMHRNLGLDAQLRKGTIDASAEATARIALCVLILAIISPIVEIRRGQHLNFSPCTFLRDFPQSREVALRDTITFV